MKSQVNMPVSGVILAIVITTIMDARGLTLFSALPLFPLMIVSWFLERFSRQIELNSDLTPAG